MYKNEWTIAGHLGHDPISRQYSNGTKTLAEMSVAVKSKMFGSEEYNTNWYKVTLFGDDALVAIKSLKKGDNVLITGKPDVNSYTNKNNEQVNDLVMIAKKVVKVKEIRYKKPANPEPRPEPKPEPKLEMNDSFEDDDDLPF